jgi:hypothetical protein
MTGCVLFAPEFTKTNSRIPVQAEFWLHDSPPAHLGVIDTSAVYVRRISLARGTTPQSVPHYDYLRFTRTGTTFLSPFYPDTLNLQTAIVRTSTGNYGF